MSLRFRLGMLLCLMAAAMISLYTADSTIARTADRRVPQEIYESFLSAGKDAEYYLRHCDGYVGIYSGSRGKTPLAVTEIELSNLRSADRALISKGIPVADSASLLSLLEDLGS